MNICLGYAILAIRFLREHAKEEGGILETEALAIIVSPHPPATVPLAALGLTIPPPTHTCEQGSRLLRRASANPVSTQSLRFEYSACHCQNSHSIESMASVLLRDLKEVCMPFATRGARDENFASIGSFACMFVPSDKCPRL